MTGLRRIITLCLVALAPVALGACTIFISDHPLSSAYPPYPPYPVYSDRPYGGR